MCSQLTELDIIHIWEGKIQFEGYLDSFRPEIVMVCTSSIKPPKYGHLIHGNSLIRDCDRNARKCTHVPSSHVVIHLATFSRLRATVNTSAACNSLFCSPTEHIMYLPTTKSDLKNLLHILARFVWNRRVSMEKPWSEPPAFRPVLQRIMGPSARASEWGNWPDLQQVSGWLRLW